MRISDWSSDVCSSDLVPDLEARVAGAEIIFLIIARTVGNMAFAVGSHDVAVGADHRERVVIMRPVLLEIARRDRELQLGGQRLDGDGGRQHWERVGRGKCVYVLGAIGGRRVI